MPIIIPGVLEPDTTYLLSHQRLDGWVPRAVHVVLDELFLHGRAMVKLQDRTSTGSTRAVMPGFGPAQQNLALSRVNSVCDAREHQGRFTSQPMTYTSELRTLAADLVVVIRVATDPFDVSSNAWDKLPARCVDLAAEALQLPKRRGGHRR